MTIPTHVDPPPLPSAPVADSPVVKTAMRLPMQLRSKLKADAALRYPTVNALYVKVLNEFLAVGIAEKRTWLRPQALTTPDSPFRQVPLHLPLDLEAKLNAAAVDAKVSLASLYYTALSEYIARASWSEAIRPPRGPRTARS